MPFDHMRKNVLKYAFITQSGIIEREKKQKNNNKQTIDSEKPMHV